MRTIATEADIVNAVEHFVRSLNTGIHVERVILFGSYVNPRPGRPDEWSDFDIAVISPDFEGLPMPERQSIIARLEVSTDRRISPIGFPSSEYRNPGRHSFLREIIRTGRVIYRAE